MNDEYDPCFEMGFPDWLWEIINDHDLALSEDCPLAGATAQLYDSVFNLSLVTKFCAGRRQAIRPETKLLIDKCKTMIAKTQQLYESYQTQSIVHSHDEGSCKILSFSPKSAAE